jgi:hypothetical protein
LNRRPTVRTFTAALVLVAGLCLLAAGCGETRLQTKGRVVKGGQPLVPREDEFVEVTFVPIVPEGGRPANMYFAQYDPATGTFKAWGPDRKGVPPGKYRVAVEYKKKKRDLLDGRFDAVRSPFVFDVDARTPELVLDLDNPPK